MLFQLKPKTIVQINLLLG